MTIAAPRRPAFVSSVVYRDNRAALEWLQRVFGFDIVHVLTDSEGNIVRAASRPDGARRSAIAPRVLGASGTVCVHPPAA